MAKDLVMPTTLQTLSPSVLSSSALALSSAVGWAAVDPPLVYNGIKTGKYFFGNAQMWKVKYASKTHLLLSWTQEIPTMSVFGYLTLPSIDFTFSPPFSSYCSLSFNWDSIHEHVWNTWDSVCTDFKTL